SKRESYLKAKNGEIVISGVQSIPNPFKLIVSFAIPVKDGAGKIRWIAVGQMNMKKIWNVTDSVHIGKTGYVMLVDASGNVVAHPDKGQVFFMQLSDEELNKIVDHKHGLLDLFKSSHYRDVAAFSAIPGSKGYDLPQWKVVALQSGQELFASAIKAKRLIIFISTGVVLLAFMMVLFLSRRITIPITRLTRRVRDISFSGNLDQRVEFRSKDELGILADSFNEMISKLKHSTVTLDYFNNIVNSMTDLLFIMNKEGLIKDINRSALERLGFKKSELLSKNVRILFPRENDFEGRMWNVLLKEEKLVESETSCAGKSGSLFAVSMSGAVLKNSSGNITDVVFALRDTTERKIAEENEKKLIAANTTAQVERKRAEELKTAYDTLNMTKSQLVQAEKLSGIGILAAGVAHELNSPLTGLMGLLRVIRKKVDSGSIEYQDIGVMLKASEHMAKIIKDLNSFARESKGEFEYIELNINDVIESTLSFSSYLLVKQSIEIIKDYGVDLFKVLGDKSQLQQVFVNIITNARDAMRDGGRFTVKTKNSDDKKYVEVSFSDTGAGIEKERLSKIFDPFYTSKKPGEGTGLGLSVSHGIIVAHMGKITVNSELGKGTQFIISLPALSGGIHGEKEDTGRG
ncbi:MAG: ATP-binding protein, partial [Pseudomonadota bacterium]